MRRACEAYSAINYEMDDEIGDSIVCLGVIGAPSDVVKRAQVVNAAKALFAPLRSVSIRVPAKGSQTKAIRALRVILRHIQRSDLNVNAAYRKIPILRSQPATVTYTRANTRNVYRKTIDEIADMLLSIHTCTAAAADRERLATLDQRHTHLALVRFRYENICANILYARLDPKGHGRILISAELPIIYATGRRTEQPEVNFPNDDAPHPTRTRKSKLESEPYLRSLPVHRYSTILSICDLNSAGGSSAILVQEDELSLARKVSFLPGSAPPFRTSNPVVQNLYRTLRLPSVDLSLFFQPWAEPQSRVIH